jgi:ABC-type branched-subunit amino acid transport system ATPase component
MGNSCKDVRRTLLLPSVVSEIEETILSLTSRDGLSILLVEQHVG